jgi:hypothetical protein
MCMPCGADDGESHVFIAKFYMNQYNETHGAESA